MNHTLTLINDESERIKQLEQELHVVKTRYKNLEKERETDRIESLTQDKNKIKHLQEKVDSLRRDLHLKNKQITSLQNQFKDSGLSKSGVELVMQQMELAEGYVDMHIRTADLVK